MTTDKQIGYKYFYSLLFIRNSLSCPGVFGYSPFASPAEAAGLHTVSEPERLKSHSPGCSEAVRIRLLAVKNRAA